LRELTIIPDDADGKRSLMPSTDATVFRWSEADQGWRPVEGETPEGLGDAAVGLYETLLISASAYALTLHAERIARSWQRMTGRPFAGETVASLHDARGEAIRQQWPALRFEVRRFPDGCAVAQIRRRDKPSVHRPVRLFPLELDRDESSYPHKSVDRGHLTQAYQRAVAAGADDALFVGGGEVRETTQAFVGLVTNEALVLPPLREDVLPSTTRTAAGDWCRDNRRAVVERPIGMDDLDAGALIYGNALIGLLPAVVVGRVSTPVPAWFSAPEIEKRLVE
jgi:branched-subunit amino acid aminotransferase/4-amino-4-deoxychorismate lyase